MDWDNSRTLDQIAYDLILADYPRGLNRKLIADQANGVQPYTDAEVEENQIQVNCNDLSMTRALQEARGQFSNAFLKQGNFFSARTDMGPVHKHSEFSTTVTHEVNKALKHSVSYFESYRSKFGLLTLHGISPAVWQDEDRWCTKPLGVDSVLIPSGTLLGFENLPFFVLRRKFTGLELQKLTLKAKRDPGWRMPMVDRCLKWVDEQTSKLMNNNWPEAWNPEQWAERKKEGGFYASDQVATIDTFDIYAWDDSDDETGWIRRIILDTWGTPSQTGLGYSMTRDDNKRDFKVGSDDFLFNSGKRKVGSSWQNIISFQFADLSAVAPFRYHSVRSLGFLLYAVCHLQNRLKCKFNEAVFEALMMLFRVKTYDDVQRALKLNMVNKGFIDDSIQPVPANERWQVNSNLVELGLQMNEGQISASTGAYAQRRDFSQDRVEKTRFQVMAESNADTALISSALAQAYQYQKFEDQEIFRRFMKKGSGDMDVQKFRASCLRQGVPEKLLVPEAWELEHERVMGGGNKTLEMQIASQLMEWRQMLDPEPQRIVLRDSITAITDDAARAKMLVPDKPVKVTDSYHDAELAAGTLMQGLPVSLKTGINHIEYIERLLTILGGLIDKTLKVQRGMASQEQITGMQAIGQNIAQHIQIIAQDENEKARVKKYGDALGKMLNEVKAMAQRLQQAQQKAAEAQQQQNGQLEPKDKAKIMATQATAAQKVAQMKQSHAEKTAQRKISFQEKLMQERQKHAMNMRKEAITTAHEVALNRLKSTAKDDATGD